ncbi:MAG: type II secretion system protein [Phycisphaerales bacterium JB039]
MPARAFTLVELIVGAVILAMIAGATAASLSSLVRASAASAAAAQATERADRAAAMIAADAVNLARRSDLRFTRLKVTDSGQWPADQDELLMLVRSRRPLRDLDFEAEGGEYEVQYRLQANATGERAALWRRRDIAFDDVQDGGGVAAQAVDGVIALSLQAGDDSDLYAEWDSDLDGLPHYLRITVVAQSDDGRRTASARRIVAIDRAPTPPETDDEATPGSPTEPEDGA